MHKPIKYAEKALTYAAGAAWFVFDKFNQIGQNPGFTPKWSDKPPVLSDPAEAARGLSLYSQSMVSVLMIGAESWRKGMAHSQHTRGLNQGAFQILKGNMSPVDPVWGKPYRWDPSTRTLSMPDAPEFEGMNIKPVVLHGR